MAPWSEMRDMAYCLRQLNVLDESGDFTGPIDVVVCDGRVAAVARNATTDAPSIDGAGLFLVPGVFDCHDHLTMSATDVGECLSTPTTQAALEAARNARRTLEAGVTFVRDLAGLDRGVRDALARGYVPGPTVQTAVVMLSETGGHGDNFLAGPGLEMTHMLIDYPGRPPVVVDGPEAMRDAVRRVLRAGADWVKLAATGGLVSDLDQPLVAAFTPAELEVAVAEASRKGVPVAAHAYGGEGLTDAVRAGVRSVEHGGFITEEQAAVMARRGCWLVPTLAAMRDCVRLATDGSLTPAQCEKILALGLDIGACVRIAQAHGVRMATGSDFITRAQHGRNLEELALMREAGLTPAEALLAATRGGAELCGVDDRRGRIAPGFVFDAIVLDADPGDLSCFHEPGAVTGVFQAGEPVVAHPRLTGAVTAA